MERLPCVVMVSLVFLVAASAAADPLIPPEGEEEPIETSSDVSTDDDYQTIVTSGRSERHVFDVDRSVHVIDAEAIEAEQSAGVLEAIASLPGVHQQRTNRGAGSPVLRGLVGPRNLIVIDGIRFNNSTFRTGPNQYLSLLSPDAVGSVEVMLGPGSVLYGSDAMGGVVHLRPRPVPLRDGVQGRMRGQLVTADGGQSLAVDGGWRRGAVYAAIGMGLHDHGALRTGAGVVAPLSSWKQDDWRARVHVDIGEGWALSGQWWGSQIQGAGRTDRLGQGDLRTLDNEDHFTWMTLQRTDTGWLRRLRASFHHHRSDEQVLRWKCAVDGEGGVLDAGLCLRNSDSTVLQRTQRSDVVDGFGGLIEAEFRPMGDAFGVVAGLESVTDFVDSSASDALAGTGFLPVDRARGNFSSGSTYTTLGAFAYADVPVLTWIGGTWSMTAGARGTWVQAEAPDVPGLGDVRYSDWGIVGTAGSRWTLSNQWNVHLNYAQGFRLPNLQETTVLGDTGKNFEVPNGELRPEMSHSGELGVRWARPGVQLTTSYSLSLIADVIVRADATFEGASTIDGAPVKQRVNSDEAIYHALDGGISLGPWERTTVFARWMWVQGDVKSADGSREPARRVPPLQGRAGATYHAFGDQLHVTVFADWAAAQTRLSSGDKEDLRICEDSSALGTVLVDCQGTAGWIDPGVQLNWFLDPKLQLNASVRNLSDSLYRHHGSGIDAPGFHARVGLVGRL